MTTARGHADRHRWRAHARGRRRADRRHRPGLDPVTTAGTVRTGIDGEPHGRGDRRADRRHRPGSNPVIATRSRRRARDHGRGRDRAGVRTVGPARRGSNLVTTAGAVRTVGVARGSTPVTAARSRRRARDHGRSRTATTGIARGLEPGDHGPGPCGPQTGIDGEPHDWGRRRADCRRRPGLDPVTTPGPCGPVSMSSLTPGAADVRTVATARGRTR